MGNPLYYGHDGQPPAERSGASHPSIYPYGPFVAGDGKTATAGRFPYANLRDGVWRSDGSAAAIERQVRLGHDPMPSFEGKLSEEEIRQVAAYVLALAHAAEGRAAAGGATR